MFDEDSNYSSIITNNDSENEKKDFFKQEIHTLSSQEALIQITLWLKSKSKSAKDQISQYNNFIKHKLDELIEENISLKKEIQSLKNTEQQKSPTKRDALLQTSPVLFSQQDSPSNIQPDVTRPPQEAKSPSQESIQCNPTSSPLISPSTPTNRLDNNIILKRYLQVKKELNTKNEELTYLRGRHVEQETILSRLTNILEKNLVSINLNQELNYQDNSNNSSKEPVNSNSPTIPPPQQQASSTPTSTIHHDQQQQDLSTIPQSTITNSSHSQHPCRDAIIITNKNSTTDFSKIERELMKIYTINDIPLEDIHYHYSKNKKTLIITTNKKNNLAFLYNAIQNNQELFTLSSIKYSGPLQKKIIILGIPNTVTEDQVIEELSEILGTFPVISYRAFKEREGRRTKQFILGLDLNYAEILYNLGNLNLGQKVCVVDFYKPLIKCYRCQNFGHTSGACTQETYYCGYCAKNHPSSDCPIKNDPKQYFCINCISKKSPPHIAHHTAFSNTCPAYINYLSSLRNTLN